MGKPTSTEPYFIPSEVEVSTPPPSNSDIFKMHFTKKNMCDGGKKMDVCGNYCQTVYQFKKGEGYVTFVYHMEKNHCEKFGLMRGQSQLTQFEARAGSYSQGKTIHTSLTITIVMCYMV